MSDRNESARNRRSRERRRRHAAYCHLRREIVLLRIMARDQNLPIRIIPSLRRPDAYVPAHGV